MSPNDADGMANSVDPDQTAPLGAVWSGSALFAQAYLSENLGSLRYVRGRSAIQTAGEDQPGSEIIQVMNQTGLNVTLSEKKNKSEIN